ncbi:hypothetical protein C8E89_12835 [Mycolicibacterium moriokaense]|uniref:Uncharacterized protein n=1 Tax=Mycolicibacterium moriokaense TaxID=39691 RepID=A0A318HBA6_9MYCO|nr:hypothetical protein C8E89_12835 [Mycolicibacterium moriokaense]
MLRFLGAFAHLQSRIDDLLAKRFFDSRIPKAAGVVWDRVVSRIRDDERTKLFQAIAAELDTDAELDNFNQVYMDVKRLRDRVGHSVNVATIPDDKLEVVSSWIPSAFGGPSESTTMSREEIAGAIENCRWLEAQILYVMDASGLLRITTTLPSRPHTPGGTVIAKPARTPGKWDGVVHRPTGGAG